MPTTTNITVACVATVVLCGCKSTVHRQATTPLIYDTAGVDPFADTPAGDRTTTFDVFYATDRDLIESEGTGAAYGNGHGWELRLGRATVTVGAAAPFGDVVAASRAGKPLPADFVDVIETEDFGRVPASLVLLDQVEQARTSAETEFAAAINAQLRGSPQQDVFVFVPGYKVDFAFPLRKGTEWWHYLGHAGAFVGFSWTTRQGTLDYLGDLEISAISSRNLRLLVELLASQTDARRIHILAHSAGTRVAAEALIQLRLRYGGDDAEELRERLRLGQVILSGSEFPFPVFATFYGEGLFHVAEQLTIHSSEQDGALGLSKWLLEWARIGELNLDDLDDEERAYLRQSEFLRFIDVTSAANATDGNGHWYWTSSPWVASDLALTLRYGLAPADRGLVRDAEGVMWVFPPDYPDRVRAIAAGQ